ncbi:MAG TPA: aminotransferase class I/II-fold pyridoxal phosphate-dependent enzyme [Gemmatimonadaceae bacterium]|nr:aminotransferase class I/II-fold pyridoxal phosphate-dependent enzyme [Gemmatimonadaceae bacterium]
MSYSRRGFLSAIGAGAAGVAVLPSFDPNGIRAEPLAPAVRAAPGTIIRLDKNENPAGPFASGRTAIQNAMVDAGRYPGANESKLVDAIAKKFSVKREQVVMGCGSTEILALCTQVFTTPSRGLVAGTPTFETPASLARQLGHPVVAVPVTNTMHLDLDAMAAAARGAGLVYLCNPNNPTSTVHGAAPVRAFLARLRKESPDTMILVDEAYHEYVSDPSYATMMPETSNKNVVVARTFSKVYGMAGLRIGYAIAAPETAAKLDAWRLDSAVNQLAIASAMASMTDTAAMQAEQKRNAAVREGVVKWFTQKGFTVAKSDANFVFVDIKRDVRKVISACLENGLAVGRAFPPLETHLRLSIGLQPEVDTALTVLGKVLV